ncbi:uncharacterized protein LOC114284511 [Camellia sinensis]|uniref:uncharacterized protein LOC114284511 n=1 Tax=Camellia sinensis TaxID=4442 RepID=UPI001036D29C|nr:uncharacterized protein LOC114284511 [Camellia sinensis]
MVVDADGITGGLLCVWRPKVFDLIDCCSNRNCIILSGKMHQAIECVVVNVYAPNDRSVRRNLWKTLGNLKPKFSKPWCIGGDFNEVKSVAERKGCIRRDGGMNGFNDFINTLELMDVPMIGKKYTWCNSQGGERWSRLDRFLVNPEWLEWFSFKLWGLSRSLSDHCPILLMEDERDWGPKPFRFLNAWVLHPTFMNKVKSVWDSTQVDGWAGYRLKVKLKSLKEALKVWNNEVFGNVEYKLKEAEHAMHALDLAAEKSRVNWALKGDRNTRYFHIMATKRMSRNLMDSIIIKGTSYNKPIEMKQKIARSIEPYQAELMVKEFSESEIRATIKECNGNKAPGPDGFNLICIQKGWRIMKDDILKFMAEFHVNGRLVKGLNASFVSLIPKKENPTISGLKINYHKSAISGVGIDEATVADFASRLNCMSQQLPFKYLGMPLGVNRKRKQIWKPLVDKFKEKLAGWKRRVLSFASKVTLIKSVLSNLPVYYMALFKIPQGIAKEIDKIQSAFLWG